MVILLSTSFSSLAKIILDVTFDPSRPAKGELFTLSVIAIVGGSIGVDCRGTVTALLQIVSATEVFSIPEIATISPASAISIGIFSIPLNPNNFVSLVVSITAPFKSIDLTLSPTLADPE